MNPRTGVATGPYIGWTGVVTVGSVRVRDAIRALTGPVLPGHWNTPVLPTLALVITVVTAVASQRAARCAPSRALPSRATRARRTNSSSQSPPGGLDDAERIAWRPGVGRCTLTSAPQPFRG